MKNTKQLPFVALMLGAFFCTAWFVSPTRAQPSRQTGRQAKQKQAPKPVVKQAVCPDPNQPCHHKEKKFDDWELSFKLPARLEPGAFYQSAPFYAVIVRTYEPFDGECDEMDFSAKIERERKRIQKLFKQKVFASHGCPNMAAVGYQFPGDRRADGTQTYAHFIALYAGATKAEADLTMSLFSDAEAEFPRFTLKKMTVGYEIFDQ